MSAEYIVLIDDQQYGPVSFDDLKAMWANGQITDDTQVRDSDKSEWAPFLLIRHDAAVVQHRETIIAEQQVSEPEQREAARIAADAQRRSAMSKNKEAQEKMPRDQPKVVVRKLDLPEVRDKLRKLTAYPELRKCVFAFQVIAGVGSIGSVLALIVFWQSGAPTDYAVEGAILAICASLSLAFSSLLIGVFLDIADALLAKLD